MDELIKEESLLEEPEESAKAEEGLDWPETPPTAPTHNYQVANKKYIDNNIPVKATGAEIITGTNDTKFATPKAIADADLAFKLVYPTDTLRKSDDTEETNDDPAYTKYKEIEVSVAGKIKTKFDLRKVTGGTLSAFGKIYVNGVAVGAEHENTTDVYVTYEDTDIDVVSGDLVQLYGHTSGNRGIVIRNFRLYWDISTKGYIDAGDDPTTSPIYKGRIEDNTAVACSDAGTNTDTVITHNLGYLPALIILNCNIFAAGQTNGANIIGQIAYNKNGAIAWVNAIKYVNTGTTTDGGIKTSSVISMPSSLSVAGTGTANVAITVSIVSITTTQFTFRINGNWTDSDYGTPTVKGISYTVIG